MHFVAMQERRAFCCNSPCNEIASWGCSKCKMRFYCSVKCQVEHWYTVHKAECKEVAKRRQNSEKTPNHALLPHTPSASSNSSLTSSSPSSLSFGGRLDPSNTNAASSSSSSSNSYSSSSFKGFNQNADEDYGLSLALSLSL